MSLRPARILFLIRSLAVGGAERQLALLATGLHTAGWQVTVCTMYAGGPLEAELRQHGVRIMALDKAGRWDLVPPLRRLWDVAREAHPDVIHGYMPTANLLSLVARRAVPSARVVWGVRASGIDWSHYDWLSRQSFLAAARLSRLADLVIANSDEGARAHVAAGYPAGRMVVVPNGIDVARFAPDPSARLRQRAAWGVEAGTVLVGLVGRIDPMKDHSTFLHAAALLGDACCDVRFVCVGDGDTSLRSRLQALAAELGIASRVRWEPASPEPREVYAALDVLTSASRYGEGFPNVVGEAMACGVPCVVTRCGDAPRVVGEAGIVVPPGDPAALAAAWLRVVAADRAAMGAAGRERIIAEFSSARLVARTMAALDPLLPAEARQGT